MSASSLAYIGLKAMSANYAALQTTGHNIANANVTGYSRQTVNLATTLGQPTNNGYIGRGVDVQSVSRAYDSFLTVQSATARSLAAMDSSRLTQLKQMENIFTPGTGGLGDAANQLFSALSDLASRPYDLASRQVVLARVNDLAGRINTAGGAFDTLQSNVTAELQASVTDVNALAKSIAAVNVQIVATQGTGQSPNDLLDQRDQLVARLSQQVQVTTVAASDGSLAVFVAGGQQLVLGGVANGLKVTADPTDASRSAISLVSSSASVPLDGKALGGGSIAGLLRFQNDDLVAGRNAVGQFAAAISGALNAQQQRGLSLQPPLGSAAGQPFFSSVQTKALANAHNATDALGNPIGSVALTITDPAALQASDYDLRESTTNPGAWQLTRLSDGKVSTVNSGDVVDGMRIDISNAQGGDRFLLQPVGRAANGLSALLTNPLDVAAASPLIASTATANTGTAAVSSLSVTASPLPTPGATTNITFNDNQGGYSWELVDANNVTLAGGSGVWQAGQSLPPAGTDFNGYSLQLSGVPRAGDVINVAPTPASAMSANNGNAMSLLGLQSASLAAGRSITDAWAQDLANVGVRVQSAQSVSDISGAVADQAEQSRSAQAGVNLDEEAARLIQYQQSYQAAAKVLQVAQAVFDTLLQASG
jgi:flagellar hook-associated protein 1 FlgK